MRVLIDSNIPMYVAGKAHVNREPAQRFLARVRSVEIQGCTSTEVLQEILHRYSAIRRPDAIQPAFDVLLGVVDEVFPIEQADVERAKEIALGVARLSARDAIHTAVMERHGSSEILTFDRGFDAVPGVRRLG